MRIQFGCMKSTSQGFTLIEAIIVVMIAGILSVVAIHKFIDLSHEARVAKAKAMAGAISSGAMLVHSKAILSGADIGAQSAVMTMNDGTTLKLSYGFPDRRDVTTMRWIVLDMGDFAYPNANGRYTLPNSQCVITYKNASNKGGPQVTLSPQCN